MSGGAALRLLLCRVLTVALAVGAPVVHAQDADARARELYQNGAMLYEEGRYEDAITAWDEAHRLSQRPLLLYNIANAQERLGMWREALETLNAYRAYARPEEREKLDRRIANLERRLASMDAAEASAPTLAPVTSSSTTTTPSAGEVRGEPLPWLGMSLVGLGVAGLGTGGVFALRANGARSEAAAACLPAGNALLCPDTVGGALRRDQISSWVADGGFALGGAALLAGGLVLFLDADAPLRLQPTPGGAVLLGRF